jgi:acyl-CoA thioester hydrolase
MPGLDPGIHLLEKKMDCRVKPGNDKSRRFQAALFIEAASPLPTSEPAGKPMPESTAPKAITPPPLDLSPQPFVCKARAIEPSWIDYNGHLNMAYYNVLFDSSLDQFFDMLGIGWNYLKERNCSTMTAECHVRYLREVKFGDPVRVNVQIIAADDKRIHYFEELRHVEEGWVSATSENMTLHIDMNLRKVAPFPKDIYDRVQAVAAAHAKAPQPDGIGRRIEIPKKR